MSETATSQPDRGLAETLRERGQRVTPQRLAIHGAMRSLDRHVTADEVLQRVSGRVPGISLPTVYATLELLAELGLVRRVDVGEGPARFDPRTDPHHHAVCRRCGRIEDVDARARLDSTVAAARRRGFEPERA